MATAIEDKQTFSEWAVLELMGHRKLAGKVTEATIAGHGLIRLDIPDGPTQFYSPSSIYCLTPVSEETARAFAKAHIPEPVTRWELPQLPGRDFIEVREEEEEAL